MNIKNFWRFDTKHHHRSPFTLQTKGLPTCNAKSFWRKTSKARSSSKKGRFEARSLCIRFIYSNGPYGFPAVRTWLLHRALIPPNSLATSIIEFQFDLYSTSSLYSQRNLLCSAMQRSKHLGGMCSSGSKGEFVESVIC
jgi:hypothetical protein